MKGHRIYAWLYDRFAGDAEEAGMADYRKELVGDLEGRVLEVGAGTGLNLAKYRSASEVVALEPDPYMRWRLERATVLATVPVKVIDGPAYPLPFDDSSFDAVVFCLVLCSVPSPRRALAEARRVLTPGGRVHFFEHVRADEPKLARRQDLIQPVWSLLSAGCHPNRDTLSAIRASGLRVEEATRFAFDVGPFGFVVRPHLRGRALKT